MNGVLKNSNLSFLLFGDVTASILAVGFAFLWTTQASKTLASRSLGYKISLKTINGKQD